MRTITSHLIRWTLYWPGQARRYIMVLIACSVKSSFNQACSATWFRHEPSSTRLLCLIAQHGRLSVWQCDKLTHFKVSLFHEEIRKRRVWVPFYPHAFLKKRRGYCNRLCPSVRLLCYLHLNHWTKFNQIWCVSYWHEWGVQCQTFFWPRPLGPWGGAKRSNII